MDTETSVNPTKSIRDRLRESIAATIDRKPIVTNVPERPGWAVTYKLLDPLRDDTLVADWAKQTGADKDDADQSAFLRAAVLGLIHCCTTITVDGEVWTDDLGNPVTFAHNDFRDAVGVANWIDAVTTFYGSKMDAGGASNLIAERSGLTGRVRETPTKG